MRTVNAGVFDTLGGPRCGRGAARSDLAHPPLAEYTERITPFAELADIYDIQAPFNQMITAAVQGCA